MQTAAKTLLKLADVRTLTAGLLPVLFGSSYALYAWGKINLAYVLLLALAVALIQAATNMFNDYMDFKRGADGVDSAEEKALVSGELTPRQDLVLIITYIVVALGIGVVIASRTSWWILLVAGGGAAVSFLYSSGPKPISRTPFGELASGLTMGLGITATVVYIQSGVLSGRVILVALPTVVYIAYIMFTNNLCDLNKDKRAGRRTLPGLLGFRTAKTIWLACTALLVLLTMAMVIWGIYPVWDLTVLLLLLNICNLRDLIKLDESGFKKGRMMGYIGKLGLEYHGLMIIGLLAAAFF